jgi:hypothetical protein
MLACKLLEKIEPIFGHPLAWLVEIKMKGY